MGKEQDRLVIRREVRICENVALWSGFLFVVVYSHSFGLHLIPYLLILFALHGIPVHVIVSPTLFFLFFPPFFFRVTSCRLDCNGLRD